MRSPNRQNIERLLQSKWPDTQYKKHKGGNAWVFFASDHSQPIAVKVLRRWERYPRFAEELRIAQSLQDIPGITRIYSINLPNCLSEERLYDLPFFVMPWYATSLYDSLKECPKDNGSKSVKEVIQILKTLEAIHARRVAHRDLKPQNILRDDTGQLFIADFGLSLDLERNVRLTPDDVIIGAAAYRGPEFLRGKLDSTDHRPGDIFSVGRLLWALLTGEEPFGLTDLEFEERTNDIQNEKRLRRPHVLAGVILACTRVDPRKRPNVSEVISALEEWEREYAPGSTDWILDKSRADDKVIQKLNEGSIASDIKMKHNSMLDLVKTEMQNIVKSAGWESICSATAGNTVEVVIGSIPSDLGPTSGLYPGTHSDVECSGVFVRFNEGDLSLSPILQLSVAFKQDLNRSSVNICEVSSGLIEDQSGKPTFGPDFTRIEYTYDTGLPATIITKAIRENFVWLDASLRDFKRKLYL